jgi:hypothetical protein
MFSARLFVFVSLLLVMGWGDAALCSDTASIDYAKAVDVATLDPALPSQPLDLWLRSGAAPFDDLQWKVGNCCNCDRRDERLCVRFTFAKAGVNGSGTLVIGTRKGGVKGSPRLETLEVPPVTTLRRLSDLPRTVTTVTQALAYAKTIDVNRLDGSLPRQPLEAWLHDGPARLESVVWTISDCDLKPAGNAAGSQPLCGKFTFSHGTRTTRSGRSQPARPLTA